MLVRHLKHRAHGKLILMALSEKLLAHGKQAQEGDQQHLCHGLRA
jgi:hypothetical protein